MKYKNFKKSIALFLTFSAFTAFMTPTGFAAEKIEISETDMITAEFKDTPLSDVLDHLASMTGKNILMTGDIKNMNVTVRFDNLPFDEVLKNLGEMFNFNYRSNGRVIKVAASNQMTTAKVYKLRYADPTQVQKEILSFIPTGVVVDTEQKTLTVDSTTTNIKKVDEVISALDVSPEQVYIIAQIIELSKDDSEKLGFKYTWNDYSNVVAKTQSSTPTSGSGESFTTSVPTDYAKVNWRFAFTSILQAEDIISKGNILASPKIKTINGKKAKVEAVDKVPIISRSKDVTTNQVTSSVEYKDIGVSLEVTPSVNDKEAGYITMDVHPTVSTIVKTIESDGVVAPQISSREAQTTVRVKNGETLIIGGLLKDEEIESITRIPFLSKLPIVGKLFSDKSSSKRNTEIVIMLRPVIEGTENGDIVNSKETKSAKKIAGNKFIGNESETETK